MSVQEAEQLLGLSRGFNETELVEAFSKAHNEIRTKLEHAPTPSLKRLYGTKLEALTEARSVLESQMQSPAVGLDLPSETPVRTELGAVSRENSEHLSETGTETTSAEVKRRSVNGWFFAFVAFSVLTIVGAYYGYLQHNALEHSHRLLKSEFNAAMALQGKLISESSFMLENGGEAFYLAGFECIGLDQASGALVRYASPIGLIVEQGDTIDASTIIASSSDTDAFAGWDGSLISFTLQFTFGSQTRNSCPHVLSGVWASMQQDGILRVE